MTARLNNFISCFITSFEEMFFGVIVYVSCLHWISTVRIWIGKGKREKDACVEQTENKQIHLGNLNEITSIIFRCLLLRHFCLLLFLFHLLVCFLDANSISILNLNGRKRWIGQREKLDADVCLLFEKMHKSVNMLLANMRLCFLVLFVSINGINNTT